MKIKEVLNKLLEIAKRNEMVINSALIKKNTNNSFVFYNEVYKELTNLNIEIKQAFKDDDFLTLDFLNLNIVDIDETSVVDIFDEESKVSINDPINQLLKEINQFSLIDRNEEVNLAIRIESGKQAQKHLDYYLTNKKELKDKERVKLEQEIEDGLFAKNEMIEANYRLVFSIAKNYTGRGVEFSDLIQEGIMGLITAIDKFDYNLGYKLSTYATPWIMQAVNRAIANQGRTVRVPVYMFDKINRMIKTERELVQKLGRLPTILEVAEQMDKTVEEIEYLKEVAQNPLSLEKPVGEEKDAVLGDFIMDTEILNPKEELRTVISEKALDELLSLLTDREEKVIKMRYGLLDGKRYTLEETGKEFNLTRERIRQIEKRAIKKLKKNSLKENIKDTLTKSLL